MAVLLIFCHEACSSVDAGGKEAQHSGSSSHSHVSFCVSWALSLKQLPDKFKIWGS